MWLFVSFSLQVLAWTIACLLDVLASAAFFARRAWGLYVMRILLGGAGAYLVARWSDEVEGCIGLYLVGLFLASLHPQFSRWCRPQSGAHVLTRTIVPEGVAFERSPHATHEPAREEPYRVLRDLDETLQRFITGDDTALDDLDRFGGRLDAATAGNAASEEHDASLAILGHCLLDWIQSGEINARTKRVSAAPGRPDPWVCLIAGQPIEARRSLGLPDDEAPPPPAFERYVNEEVIVALAIRLAQGKETLDRVAPVLERYLREETPCNLDEQARYLRRPAVACFLEQHQRTGRPTRQILRALWKGSD